MASGRAGGRRGGVVERCGVARTRAQPQTLSISGALGASARRLGRLGAVPAAPSAPSAPQRGAARGWAGLTRRRAVPWRWSWRERAGLVPARSAPESCRASQARIGTCAPRAQGSATSAGPRGRTAASRRALSGAPGGLESQATGGQAGELRPRQDGALSPAAGARRRDRRQGRAQKAGRRTTLAAWRGRAGRPAPE